MLIERNKKKKQIQSRQWAFRVHQIKPKISADEREQLVLWYARGYDILVRTSIFVELMMMEFPVLINGISLKQAENLVYMLESINEMVHLFIGKM